MKDASFIIVGGLAGKGISFRSASDPRRYIRHRNYKLYADVNDNSALFKRDATFNVRYGLGASNGRFGISFESINFAGYFISLNGARAQIVKMANTAAFKMSATFSPVIARVKITHQTSSVACGYTCQKGKLQMGHDMAHSKEASRPNCAKKCCMTKGCIGFDFDNLTKDCWLSKTPWSKVPPTGGLLALTKITCQKSGVHDEPEAAVMADITTEGEQPVEDEYVYEDAPESEEVEEEEISDEESEDTPEIDDEEIEEIIAPEPEEE